MMHSKVILNFLTSPMVKKVVTSNVRIFSVNNSRGININACWKSAFLSSPHVMSYSTLLLQPNQRCSSQILRNFFQTCVNNQSKSDQTTLKKDEGLASDLLSSKLKSSEAKPVDDTDSHEEEKKRTVRALRFTAYALGFMLLLCGGSTIIMWGSPSQDEMGQEIKDDYSELPIIQQYLWRAYGEARSMNKMIQEPIRDKLLPDPVQPPYQPRYTLILELRDVLVHPEWTYSSGWRFKKRPGVDFLLQHCGPPFFEIVIFSKENAFSAYPVVDKLDRNGTIWYRLFREATRYENGKHYKDLYCLNRDLNRVIAVDWDSNCVTSERNVLHLKKWDGDMEDKTLFDLAFMLRTIAESGIGDVRDVLDYYRTCEDPLAAFKENERKAQEQEAERQKYLKEQAQSRGLLEVTKRSLGFK